MIIHINERKYEFKTSFAEYSIEEYLSLIEYTELPLIERVSKYTSIPVEVLSKLHVKNFTSIAEQVQFVEDEEMLNALAIPFEGEDVGLRAYGELERAKAIMQKDGLIKGCVQIAELYTGLEIAGKPLLEVWHVCLFYINSINSFFARFKRLSLHEYTDEEVEAGVEQLEGFKHWGNVFKIGKERGMTNDEVLGIPAIEVYTEMLYDFESSEYQKRYQQIIEQRQQHFAKLNK